MLSLANALERVKGRVSASLPEKLIHDLCREVGHRWRDRDLGPVVTTHLFVQQVLHGNIAVGHLRRLTGLTFTDAAYCQARARLPRKLLERLQQAVTHSLRTADDEPAATWHGHRTYLLDGSGFSMRDTAELQEQFGQPGGQAQGCGFPVAHLLLLFDAAAGFLLQTSAAPLRTHDLADVPVMHEALRAGDVLVGDRAFGSYAHLALCQQRGLHGVFRAHQKQLVDFRPYRRQVTRQQRKKGRKGPSSRWLKRLGLHDQVVEYVKPKQRPAWLSAEEYAKLPPTLLVRELRYKIHLRGRRTREVTLVTSLLDPDRYSAAELAKLYGQRWQVETDLKYLKNTLGLDVLRCEKVEGVLKELTLFVLIYNLVRRVMQEAARRQEVEPARISFIDAWRWLRHARPGDALPKLIVNPKRGERVEPRVRKRRPKEFPLMKRPREELRKALFRQKAAA